MAKLYSAYLFRGKDKAIDEIRTVVEDHFGHRVTKKDLTQIAADGGPTAAAMSGWFFGKTMRPQSATLEAAGRARANRRTWKKMKEGK